MDDRAKRFIIPIQPCAQPKINNIYPWDISSPANLYQDIYEIALKTGYIGTFSEFKNTLGAFLQAQGAIINQELYDGQYEVIPLPETSQILRTTNKLMSGDVVVKPIPYYETSNDAGGYTVFIG